MTKQETLLAKIALKKNYLTQEQLDQCLQLQKSAERPKPLVILLIEQGFISDQELNEIIQYQQKYQKKQLGKKEEKKEEKKDGKKRTKTKSPTKTFSNEKRFSEPIDNAYYCGFCNGPISEKDEKCPRCGAMFTSSETRNEQIYSCASCNTLVSPSDKVCSNCGAHFDD